MSHLLLLVVVVVGEGPRRRKVGTAVVATGSSRQAPPCTCAGAHVVVGGWALKDVGLRLEASGVWNPWVRAASHQQGMRLLPVGAVAGGLGLLTVGKSPANDDGSPAVHRDGIWSRTDWCGVMLRLLKGAGEAGPRRLEGTDARAVQGVVHQHVRTASMPLPVAAMRV